MASTLLVLSVWAALSLKFASPLNFPSLGTLMFEKPLGNEWHFQQLAGFPARDLSKYTRSTAQTLSSRTFWGYLRFFLEHPNNKNKLF